MSDGSTAPPALPTYKTVAGVLERKNGSGIKLVGWTVARSFLIAPPMLLVGVPVKKAFLGAALSSALISVLTLVRVYNANFEAEWAAERGLSRPRRR